MKLYRAMKAAADGLPEVGSSARSLGVRGLDQAPDHDVQASGAADPVRPGEGGMSAVPDDPMSLARHRRPAALSGTGKDPVWVIDETELGSDLAYRRDKPTHGLVEPAGEMTLAEYQQALLLTRPRWRRVTT